MVDKKLLEEQIAQKKEELARLEAALLAESEKPGKESSSWHYDDEAQVLE